MPLRRPTFLHLAIAPAVWASFLCAIAPFAMFAGCSPPASRLPAPATAFATFGADAASQISIHNAKDRPVVTTVLREGDPAAAIAASILTDGDSLASTALAALIEARLRASAIRSVGTHADRDGFRVVALASSPEDGVAFLQALRTALSTPASAGAPELLLVKSRLDALRAHPLDAPALLPGVRCTGELSALATDPWLDPTTPYGVARLDQLRAQANVVARVSIAAVGSAAFGHDVARAVDAQPPWNQGTFPSDPWPERDHVAVYPRVVSNQPATELSLALRVRDAFAATAVAERSADPASPLLARINSASGWDVTRIAATVRPRGACISLTLRKNNGPSAESEAAAVAALAVNELENAISEVRSDGSVAGRQVLRATDPREAASLAAWWSQSSRLEPGPDRLALTLGVPPASLAPNAIAQDTNATSDASSERFANAFGSARLAWSRSVIEARSKVEAGQGELWILAATPCGVLSENPSEAGVTALAAIAAASAGALDNNVTIEPWIAQDGVGILAHAAALPNEGPHALAGRVADAAAHVLVHQGLSDTDVARARAELLPRLDRPDSPFDAGVAALATTLVPSHPSWILPLGLRTPIIETGSAAVALRWSSLADGPIRVAVLANTDRAQADATLHAFDRWIVRLDAHPRGCPTAGTAPVRSTGVQVVVDTPGPQRSLLGIGVSSPEPVVFTMLELLAESLDGPDGLIDRALAPLGGRIRAQARVVGGIRFASLVIELRGVGDKLDDATRNVQAALDRLAKGSATTQDLERARGRLDDRDREVSIDPRARVVALWHDVPAVRPIVGLAAWNTWLRTTLAPGSVSSVRLKPAEAATP